MRRLDLHPQKKLRNPARHVRSLEKWSRSFAGFFPTREMARDGLWFENIPIFEKAVAAPAAIPPSSRARNSGNTDYAPAAAGR